MIYTPRCMVDSLNNPILRNIANKQMCTKVEFRGYEISIAMDSSHGDGDLTRIDIRVFRDNLDVTYQFLEIGETMIYGNSESLFDVMLKINKLNPK